MMLFIHLKPELDTLATTLFDISIIYQIGRKCDERWKISALCFCKPQGAIINTPRQNKRATD